MNNKPRVGIYGGAFNPPHAGHARVIRQALESLDQVLIVPSFAHGFGKEMVDFDLRLDWCESMAMAMRKAGYNVMVEDIESELGMMTGKPVYTWDMLNAVQVRLCLEPGQMVFLIGEDNKDNIAKFYKATELLATYEIMVIKETLPVHSSLIKERVGLGEGLDPNWIPPGFSHLDYLQAVQGAISGAAYAQRSGRYV